MVVRHNDKKAERRTQLIEGKQEDIERKDKSGGCRQENKEGENEERREKSERKVNVEVPLFRKAPAGVHLPRLFCCKTPMLG